MKKKALIIGAGPAGLTAAYELLKKGNDIEVVVFEESDCFGGISRTVEYKGNRMDMGGHRFFSKIPEVNAWWDQMLPMQGAPSYDDLELDREVPLEKNGPDPEKEDRVMLTRHRVSRILFDKRVVMLDMASVVAGTKYRGQFEERIRSIINELQKNPNVILFIDEIHTIVGAGAAAGSMDAANLLKPALARGEIQCIGATTLDEYRKNRE